MGTLAKTPAGRLHAIKQKTGGNRENRRWDQGTGVPLELTHRITPPGKLIRRIFSQLGFAIILSGADREKGLYTAEIEKALDILEKSLVSHGVLTNENCKLAEEVLLPLQKTAKEYTVLFASHAHIDMNWMWSWQETVQSALATFRTMLTLMDEYPDFTFSQSQASCYHLVEKYDPELMQEIIKRIKEGRWEVTASSWVETDKNMPCTESLLRHIRYTKNYLESVWGVNPSNLNIDFSPDTFGHSAHVPEIDNYGNVKYMYHCRGFDKRQVLYRWRAASGAELLCHCEPNWYNRGIQDEIAFGSVELASLCGGLKTSLIVYGVGDHGGGPTRRDIEHILEMQEWPVYPQLRFGTFAEYFKTAESVRDKVPVVDKEINFFAAGCYTTQSRIKLANRRTEAALLDAEFLDSVSFPFTKKHYPPEKLEEAWQRVLFNHFHDILTGSCVRDTRDHAMANYSDALAVAGTAREKAGLALAALIDTSMFVNLPDESADIGNRSEGAGPGFGLENFGGIPCPERGRGSLRIYHVFNPSAYKRAETVEFVLWDWYYELKRMELFDHKGKNIPYQIIGDTGTFWDHQYNRFIAKVEVPAGGYTTITLREKDFGEEIPVFFHTSMRADSDHANLILENEFIRAEFDTGGALVSLADKKTGKEKIASGKTAGPVIRWAEKRTNNAWMTGRYLAEDPVSGKAVKLTPNIGSIRKSIEIEQEILDSKITTTVSLDEGAKELCYQFKIDWNEAARDHKNIPVLCFALPLSEAPDFYQCDVPAGIQKRPDACHDIPALQYTAAVNGGDATAIITDCKYGYRGHDNVLYATIINTTYRPDPYPERGEHIIKLWVALLDSSPKTLYETAFNFCHPVSIVTGIKYTDNPKSGQKGFLPPERELLGIVASSTVISSSGITADGNLLIRLYETAGAKDSVTVNFPLEIKNAELTDLDGKIMEPEIPLNVKGNSVSFDVPANRILGLKVEMKG